jgi:phage tail-like protein
MADTHKGRYQTVNFHFRVKFIYDIGEDDYQFQSVSGLDSTLETETIKEGGENRFEHVVPVRRKYGPLILKRGILKPKLSEEEPRKNPISLSQWLKDAFDSENIVAIPTVIISLLSEEQKPLMTWSISNVWPRSWKIGELNAEQGAVLIETMELNYNQLILT